MRLEDVTQKPLITEKAAKQREVANEYFFAVHPQADKNMIRLAVEKLFGVKVIGVYTMHRRGKEKMFGRRRGRTSDWKKAIVKLRAKDTIKVFEGT